MSARDPLATFRRRWQRARDVLQLIVEEGLANLNEARASGDPVEIAKWETILREEGTVLVDLPPQTDLAALLDRLGRVEARVEELERVTDGMEVEA